MKVLVRRLGAVALAAVGLGVVTPAAAVISPYNVTNHGSECVGLNATSAGRIAYDNYGVRNASSAESALVWCPAGMHTVTGTNSGWVTVWHDGPTQTVSCTYHTTDLAGRVIWSGANSVGPGQPNPKTLFFSPINGGTASVMCTLPAANNGAAYVSTIHTFDAG